MRWIDFEGKTPMDDDIPGWTPWSGHEWTAWLDESDRLTTELERLNATGLIAERNQLIDDHSDHWGKLKPWLSALSHGKCWFTEAKDLASHMDVEHFRPKKEAKNWDDATRDGYWWRAFDYTNYRFAGNVPNRKKGGWFPLHPQSPCSLHDARCDESEDYGLLDPIEQTDADLLAFDDSGDAIPIPGTVDPWQLQRVKVSIDKYKLNEHDALPGERRVIWKAMDRTIRAYFKAKNAYRPGINQAPRKTMKEKALKIREMTQKNAELSSVALWRIRLWPNAKEASELLRLAA